MQYVIIETNHPHQGHAHWQGTRGGTWVTLCRATGAELPLEHLGGIQHRCEGPDSGWCRECFSWR